MEITSEIFEVGGGRLTSPEDAAIYLIKFGRNPPWWMPDAAWRPIGFS